MADTVTSAKLSADASDYMSVMNRAENFTGAIAGKISHHFTSAKMVGTAVATALGLNFEKLAGVLTKPLEESAEAAKSIAEESDKATQSVLELIRAHQSQEQQLKALQKEARILAQELGKPAKEISLWRQALGATLLHFGFLNQAADVLANTEANAVKQEQTKAEIQAIQLQLRKAENAVVLERIKFEEDMYKFAEANRKELELEAKLTLGTINPAEMDQLRIIRLQNKEKLIQTEINILLEKPVKQWTDQEKMRFNLLQRQSKEIEKQIDLIEHPLVNAIKDADKETNTFIQSMGTLFDEVAQGVDAWKDFKLSISTTGRGNRELSDAELKKKIATSRADIAGRQIALNAQSGVTGSAPFDPLLAPQQSNLQQALNELQLRQTVRRNIGAFGESQAFNMFAGSQQRFDQIKSGMSPAETTRLANALEKLNRHFDRGVPFVFAPATGTPQGQITPTIPNG